MRRPAVVTLMIMAGFLAACGRGDMFSPIQFAHARGRWEAHEPVAYRFRISRSCECTGTEAVIVEVRNGVVQSRRYAANGALVPAEGPGLYPSIDGIFDLIEQFRREGVDQIAVRYDDELGYPRSISVDRYREAVDDEVYYSIRDFERLPAD